MNRDRLRFRVWNKNKNRYAKQTDYEERFWVGMEGRIHEDDGFDRPKTLLYPGDDDYDRQTWQRIDNFVVEQCTGLKDREGKLIFVGDILRSSDGSNYSVEYDLHYARFLRRGKFHNGNSFFADIDSTKAENLRVIGNVHENPELL